MQNINLQCLGDKYSVVDSVLGYQEVTTLNLDMAKTWFKALVQPIPQSNSTIADSGRIRR